MSTKTTVIHHSADYDGIFCREIARKFLPNAELIGWDYGNPKLPFPPEGKVYVLDLSPECFDTSYSDECHSRLVWIDHHKSAIDRFWSNIPGYRIDGVAACRLAWQWFTTEKYGSFNAGGAAWWVKLPTKEQFVSREVKEPVSVRLAGEYDIWDKRDPDADLFQHGLRSMDLTGRWNDLLAINAKLSVDEIERLVEAGHHDMLAPDGTTKPAIVWTLLENGRALQYANTKENESVIKAAGFTIEFEGLKFLACNAARYNSHLFTAGLTPEHDGCFGFAYRDGHWAVSLYHAPGKEHHDLSQIAVKYGGGGHRGACGFRAKTLPFLA
jgi:hypothetical protein